jgi:protein-S-isoprenylcysteine O-methyltransferase Ste14
MVGLDGSNPQQLRSSLSALVARQGRRVTYLMVAIESTSFGMGLALKFVTALLLLLAAYATFRIFVRRDYRKKGRLTPFSSFLQFFLFLLHGFSSYVYLGSSQIGRDSPFFLLAILFMVAGVILLAIAMTTLGMGDVVGLKVAGLKTSGFYRYTRNPQIVTGSLFYIGYAILWLSWAGLVWLGLFWIMLHLMVLTEEEHLRRSFGEEYERYCEKTPRYFGF